jgi:3-hydroxyacyl-CoA dehydrogenase
MSMRPNESEPPFPEQAEFWKAAGEGRLLLKWCNDCGKPHYYPRVHCPLCGASHTEWREASGRGRIYSFTLTGRGAGKVVAPAVIELEEGIRVTAIVSNADLHELAIGDEVVVAFEKTADGTPLLAFTTPQANAARDYSTAALTASGSIKDVEPHTTAASLNEVAVVGAGRMGVGIAFALLAAGIFVQLVDREPLSLEKAKEWISAELQQLVAKGRVGTEEATARLKRLQTSCDMAAVGRADLVIEAVWEQMALKKEIFRLIDAHAKPDAVLGTNTSTLDIDEIAAATRRPESVIGLHFFSPAHVMKLLEIVRAGQTGLRSLVAARDLAQRLGKVGVVVGVCHGFVGNRLMIAREAEAGRLLLEGATPHQVDRVLTEFGLPMGTFELQDMAGGIELSYRRRQETGEKNWLIDRLYEMGRSGLRAGKGYYRYEAGKRTPIVDPEVTALIEEASKQAGITRHPLSDREVLQRLVYVMVNEGAKLTEEGIVERGSDIDVVWQYGFGWPAWKGGPMYYADQVGLTQIVRSLTEYRTAHGDRFAPAALLEQRARSGARLSS